MSRYRFALHSVLRSLHHDVSEPLHVGEHRGRRCVALVHSWRLNTCGVCAVGGASSCGCPTPRTGGPLGSTRSTVTPQGLRQRARCPRRVSQPHQIGLLGHKGRPEELLMLAARISTPGALASLPQVQLVVGAQRRGEPG